jgi:hypothetical protein
MEGMPVNQYPTMTDDSYALLASLLAHAIIEMRHLGMAKAQVDRMRSAATIIPSIITYRKASQ